MKSVTSLRKSQEWRDNQQDARCNDEIQRNTFQVMQPRHPIDEISRNQAANHAKNRTTDGSKAQNGSIENNGAPRHENRKDQDAQRNGTYINLIFRHDAFQTRKPRKTPKKAVTTAKIFKIKLMILMEVPGIPWAANAKAEILFS